MWKVNFIIYPVITQVSLDLVINQNFDLKKSDCLGDMVSLSS